MDSDQDAILFGWTEKESLRREKFFHNFLSFVSWVNSVNECRMQDNFPSVGIVQLFIKRTIVRS